MAKRLLTDHHVFAACLPQALEMATINGARALGLDARVGSLKPGKAADMVAFTMNDITALPVFDVESHLVYTSTADTCVPPQPATHATGLPRVGLRPADLDVLRVCHRPCAG